MICWYKETNKKCMHARVSECELDIECVGYETVVDEL